jgi:kumamolisin
VGRLPAAHVLRLSIALPLRSELELDQLLQEIDDPQSASYHQFLSVQEFTDRFGPSKEDYDAVIHFAKAAGLTVTGTALNRMVVDVAGPVGKIEQAFHVTLSEYQHPTEGRTFFAPDREPTADLPVALWHVTGLENYSMPHPASLRREPLVSANATGSGPSGDFLGSDMRAAYYGGTALSGSGETVGLVEFGGYNVNDVRTYFSQVGQPLHVHIVGVSTDGSSLSCGRLRQHGAGIGHRAGDLDGTGPEGGPRLRVRYQRCQHLQQDGFGPIRPLDELFVGMESGRPEQ